MKRRSKIEVETALRAGEFEALRSITDDVDPRVAADAILKFWGSHSSWHVARRCQDIPEPVIELVLEGLSASASSRGHAVFLLEASRLGSWRDALEAYLELNSTYAWGSKTVRERVAKYAKSPLLGALQASVIAGVDVPLMFLAVLAHDGSDASLDALVTRFIAEKDVDLLRRLKTHAAKTDELEQFFETIEFRIADHARSSGVLDFAKSIGFDVDVFEVRISFGSEEKNGNGVSAIQGNVAFDSGSANWFHVSVSRVAESGLVFTSYFSTDDAGDTLNVGRCEPRELPQWFAKTAKTLGVHWKRTPHFHGSLRGKKRQLFVDWLFSEVRGEDERREA